MVIMNLPAPQNHNKLFQPIRRQDWDSAPAAFLAVNVTIQLRFTLLKQPFIRISAGFCGFDVLFWTHVHDQNSPKARSQALKCSHHFIPFNPSSTRMFCSIFYAALFAKDRSISPGQSGGRFYLLMHSHRPQEHGLCLGTTVLSDLHSLSTVAFFF